MSISLALLVSSDPAAVQLFSHALQELSILPDVCHEVPAAVRLLNQRKFDAVIVDLQLGDESALVLDEVHLSGSNRTAVTFAISGSDAASTAALRKTSSFLFERPLSAQSIRNVLRPAYGLILRERRRYFRCPISNPVLILRNPGPDVRCSAINVSEGGMAVSTLHPFKAGEQIKVQFTLPGQDVLYLADATVCWLKTEFAGIRFDSFPEGQRAELQVWLAQKLEEQLPGSVTESFQNTNERSTPTI